MFDSLPFRNDAAQVFRRLIRSLPRRSGVVGVATCDKGLPAMMMALAAMRDLPCVLVPGGVTLPAIDGEDAGTVQTLGARFSHGLLSLEEASDLGCRACGTPGGGCQFLGTAATAQVVGEALGMAPAHTALAPSGEVVWLEAAERAARLVMNMEERGLRGRDWLTDVSIRNAMVVHAAFGGSTNLLLHLPAVAHAAGLRRPTVEDWIDVNRRVPRLVSVLPNGPVMHPTVRVFMAGGVPEVLLHLRRLGVFDGEAWTVEGRRWNEVLDLWEVSERRRKFRERLREADGVDPDQVILSPEAARAAGITNTLIFPRGNLAPEGAVVKATAIDRGLVDGEGWYRHEGPARVFTSERTAMAAIKEGKVRAGDVLVLAGCGPMGTGMEETYQLTSALKHLPSGKQVALITDARFSGVSTGACVGHVGPEALAGGPIGRIREGDRIRVELDFAGLVGRVDLVGTEKEALGPEAAERLLAGREAHSGLAPHPQLPGDTRLWAALQRVSGGTWGGCVYDVEAIVAALESR
jgi:putative YjhG/YagF family dehydratase